MVFNPFDCFPHKGTLFLLFFKFQNIKNVYLSEENVCFLILLTVFLVRVNFVYIFFQVQLWSLLFFTIFSFFFSRYSSCHYFLKAEFSLIISNYIIVETTFNGFLSSTSQNEYMWLLMYHDWPRLCKISNLEGVFISCHGHGSNRKKKK